MKNIGGGNTLSRSSQKLTGQIHVHQLPTDFGMYFLRQLYFSYFVSNLTFSFNHFKPFSTSNHSRNSCSSKSIISSKRNLLVIIFSWMLKQIGLLHFSVQMVRKFTALGYGVEIIRHQKQKHVILQERGYNSTARQLLAWTQIEQQIGNTSTKSSNSSTESTKALCFLY